MSFYGENEAPVKTVVSLKVLLQYWVQDFSILVAQGFFQCCKLRHVIVLLVNRCLPDMELKLDIPTQEWLPI